MKLPNSTGQKQDLNRMLRQDFYTTHGTHVAGTIAAQGNNPYGIKGLAPKIELYAYRVLGAYGSGANSQIIAGINKAVEQKMDVINLSLGSTSNSQTATDAIAINNAVLAGVTACIANGNEGPNRATIGSPATAAFAISVGNSTKPETYHTAAANITMNGSTKSYPMDINAWTFGTDPKNVLTGTYSLVAVPNIGDTPDYAGLDVKGKVVLVSRGTTTFVDKVQKAKANGAAAIIIHNSATGTNSPGPANGTNHYAYLSDSFEYIPDFDMSYTDGSALRTALASNAANVTFTNFASTTSSGDLVNNSSSRGPANPVFDIKPDVTAPGTNIMSSIPAYGKDYLDSGAAIPDGIYSQSYEKYTGTSMAAPHIAGISALLKSEHPDWTPFDIKVAISNTAKQLDVTKFDVFAQGPGRVQPLKAATTEALAYVYDTTSYNNQTYDNIKGTITFGNVTADANNSLTVTRDIVLKSLSDSTSNYTAAVQTTKNATGSLAGAAVTIDKSSFTLAGEQKLTVTLSVPMGTGTTGSELLGYVVITNGTTTLNLPFAANFAPPSGLKSFTIDSNHISPNGDGKLDSTTVRYEFHNNQDLTYIEIIDLANPDAGYYEDGGLGWIVNTNSTSTGPQTTAFTGKYHEFGNPGSALDQTLPDGVYGMFIETTTFGGEWFPVFVKTSAPKIVAPSQLSVESDSYVFSGLVDDEYLTFISTFEEYDFDLDYDGINSFLNTKYELTDSSNTLISSGPVTLTLDGEINLPLSGLTSGVNKLKLIVDDAAANHAEQVVSINYLPVKQVTGVALDKSTLNFAVGDAPRQLTAVVAPADAINNNVTWTSSNPSVAAVDSNGLVTPGAAGTATITVTTAEGGFTASSQVTVSLRPNIKVYAKDSQVIADLSKKLDFYLALSNTDSVNALDATFRYDKTKFKLSSVELINQPDMIQAIDDNNGTVRLLAGFTKPITSSDYTDVIKITLEPLNAVERNIQANIQLISAITASKGVNIDVLSNNTGDKADILLRTYKDLVDINEDGIATVADLSKALEYYRVTSADADWSAAKRADVNFDGVVDISDFTIIMYHIIH